MSYHESDTYQSDVRKLMESGMDRATAQMVASVNFSFEKVFGFDHVPFRAAVRGDFIDDSSRCAMCWKMTDLAFATRCNGCERDYQASQRQP